MIEQLKQFLQEAPPLRALEDRLTRGDTLAGPIRVSGAAGSLLPLVAAILHEQTGAPILLVARDRESAERIRDDLSVALPASAVTYYSGEHSRGQDPASDAADVEALRAAATGAADLLLTHPHALALPVPSPDTVRASALSIESGSAFTMGDLRHRLEAMGFVKHDFVGSPGDYAVRGGILDVFPFTGETPVRVEFFGDTVESLRQFDPLSQRSIKDLSVAVIVPDLYHTASAEEAPSPSFLAEYLGPGTVVVLDEPDIIRTTLEHPGPGGVPPAPPADETFLSLASFPTVHFAALGSAAGSTISTSPPGEAPSSGGPAAGVPGQDGIALGGTHQPAFNGSIRLLHEHLVRLTAEGYRVIITCDGHAELARMKELLAAVNGEIEEQEGSGRAQLNLSLIAFSLQALHAGFSLPGLRLAVYTEHQVFGRLKRRGRKRASGFKGFSQKELQQLHKGDFVVHRDYGIGRFTGLRKIRVRTAEQEVVSVQYEGNDMLYVNLNYVNRLQKYSSKEGHVPRLNRLGSSDWDRLKARVKSRVKDIARDLIRLYAHRKRIAGHAFRQDTPWQKELEASFMYEDTFDQSRATREVKEDMEAQSPMDRLICGDVGFGKTEVAVRAAFKAVMDGKQAAILVPTTILSVQHYHTFLDRASRYSLNVQVISRFKSRKEQQAILAELKKGTVDIIIGTHRLLSKDVIFKDLGLLIIDEEHRFGVAAKEKLRMLRTGVDTLALTATPIPRTLHFSLMGARDLSIIATPPRNRLPIVTEITRWNDDLIREAVTGELNRGGQVYVVHDRVQNIEDIAGRLREILPGIRLRHAHGQMKSHELEEVMMEFLEKKFDVLVATKIIESGLDIPSVNTIIVNRADRFGMAELYQLRGRVGRSNVQAYAYLLTPPISLLPRATLQRLQALEEFTELGSGFNLAMRDLEIRGAGNLLGSEQSGFIETMGFDTYTRILEEAIQELKEEEFQDLFHGEERGAEREDVIVEADVDAFIPEAYLGNDTERLAMYRRLYALSSEEQLREAADEMRDRFGVPPQEVELLFTVVRLRLTASRLGFKRLRISSSVLEAEFPPESRKQFYESDDFSLLMTVISHSRVKHSGLRQDGSTLLFFHEFPPDRDQASFMLEAHRILTELHHARENLRVPVNVEK